MVSTPFSLAFDQWKELEDKEQTPCTRVSMHKAVCVKVEMHGCWPRKRDSDHSWFRAARRDDGMDRGRPGPSQVAL